MQLLTAAPRNQLTVTQVQMLLRDSPSLAPQRGLELLDLNLNVLSDLSDVFRAGTTQRDSTQTIQGECSLTVDVSIPDLGLRLLRPYMTFAFGALTARFNGGVYCPFQPATTYDGPVVSNVYSGFDRLFQLNRPVGYAYVVLGGTGGTTYLAAIAQAFTDAGIADAPYIDGTAAGVPVPTTRIWPQLVDSSVTDVQPVDAVADDNNATTWLRVINDLLAAIGYRALWVDWDGRFRCDPYVDAAARTPEFVMDFDDPRRALVAPSRQVNRDISKVPNRWIGQQQNLVDADGNPLELIEGAGQYTLSNDATGDTSIAARGGDPLGVYTSYLQLDAADQASLVTQVQKQATSDMNAAAAYAVSTSPFPAAWHEDIYSYPDQQATGGVAKVLSTGWTLDWGDDDKPAQDMQHTWLAVA